jgi:hypothetical protein
MWPRKNLLRGEGIRLSAARYQVRATIDEAMTGSFRLSKFASCLRTRSGEQGEGRRIQEGRS